ncbi:hypothetical protein NL445_29490, partial [Klebsiella pneumoniae]|nr:hypothetical protein [Klebsiella pneumoniae]
FALVIDYDTRIVLKVYKYSITPSEWFPLPDDHCRHYLFPEFRFTLFDCGHNHVPGTGRRQSVQATFDTLDSDHIQILC